jgi:hypothetical protein
MLAFDEQRRIEFGALPIWVIRKTLPSEARFHVRDQSVG